MKKTYITAQDLLNDSFKLAIKIIESGFKPDLIVGIWRGGTPIAIAIHEAFDFIGLPCDHIAIRTSSYNGIGKPGKVNVTGLEYLQGATPNSQILFVDDVFDTGLSIDKIIHDLQDRFKEKLPTIKVAVPFFKPKHNQTTREPDFYLHETVDWLVFPHEIQGLSDTELLEQKVELGSTKQQLLNLRLT